MSLASAAAEEGLKVAKQSSENVDEVGGQEGDTQKVLNNSNKFGQGLSITPLDIDELQELQNEYVGLTPAAKKLITNNDIGRRIIELGDLDEKINQCAVEQRRMT